MLALIQIAPWHWVAFTLCVLFFLALDLGVFHRQAHTVRVQEAICWTILWVSLALLFGAALFPLRGSREAVEFFTGYFIELSLSMDNVFVIALIFTFFGVTNAHQHRVLFWGVVGALLMRGIMIGAGVALINRFEWLLFVMGGVLLLTGAKMLFSKEGEMDPEKSGLVRVARRFLPISKDFDGSRFVTRSGGRRMFTPLFLVLLLVEASDLVFALDSIPAIFGVTRQPFIVFTSNVFAMLGLRSLYSILAGAMDYFRFLKVGLSVVLLFIGVKMLIDPHEGVPRWFQYDIPDGVSLIVVVGIISMAMLVSVLARQRAHPPTDGAPRR